MTENLPKDGVQSRQAVAQRCCLKTEKLIIMVVAVAPFIVSLCVTEVF